MHTNSIGLPAALALKKNSLFFLNRNYYVAAHLAERLEEIKSLRSFADFEDSIDVVIISLERFIGKTESLINVFGDISFLSAGDPLISILETAFNRIHDEDMDSPFIALLDYISIANSLLEGSTTMIKLLSDQSHEVQISSYTLSSSVALQSLQAELQKACCVL